MKQTWIYREIKKNRLKNFIIPSDKALTEMYF